MMRFRLLLLSLSTLLSVAAPVTVSACGAEGENMGSSFIQTPVSLRGQFIFVNRISRRTLRNAVAERQQSVRYTVPLIREIL